MSGEREHRVIVQGAGDVGSAVAHELFRRGCRVVLMDVAAPAHARRGMAFTDALFEGKTALAAVWGKRSELGEHLAAMLRCGRAIPVVAAPLEALLAAVEPDVLIDARMRKRAQPEPQRGLAPLTVGLGPNFVAGGTVDLAVETQWGEQLGAVLRQGSTAALAGEPKPIEGRGRERYVYAPCGGRFATDLRIGDRVRAGQAVAMIGDTTIAAPIAGCLRGLTHDGVWVAAGTKVVEVDPRGEPAAAFGLGERPRRIASGVAAALLDCSSERRERAP